MTDPGVRQTPVRVYRTVEEKHVTDRITIDTLRALVARCDHLHIDGSSHVDIRDSFTDTGWVMTFRAHGEVQP